MSAANFSAVMAEIFKHEGGYVDHPKDPGGATNMGVTFAVLQEWRGEAITKQDVKELTKSEAQEIYRKRYWNAIKGDDLPAGLDLVMMDGSVNSGVGRGPKWVQAALGVPQDGKVGPKTITAAWSANIADTINAACEARLVFLRSLKTYSTFGKGWERRVEAVRKKALEMAKMPNLKPSMPQDDIDHYGLPDAPMKVATVNIPTGSNTVTVPPAKTNNSRSVAVGGGIVITALLALAKGLGWM